MRHVLLFALALSFTCVSVCRLATVAAEPTAKPKAENAAYPLKASSNGRFLVDRNDRPFLLVGDTAWSLIVQPDEAGIDRYLDDRAKRGFNAIIVNLIEHRFASRAPATRAGVAPFKTPGDFSTPDPAYFDFAHRVVEKAAARGICVWLFPAYLGANGGEDGWFKEMKACGREKVLAYARFVAGRFRDLPNVVWVVGGDFTPPAADLWTATDVGRALHEADPARLVSGHPRPEDTASSAFGDEAWLGVDAVYSYNPVLSDPVVAQYRRERRTPKPFVLLETTYEGEHDSTPPQIRRLAWSAMLGGACGQFFGNNPIWHFDGPGIFETKVTWQQALDGPGSRDMTRLRDLLAPLPWHRLAPEQGHNVVTDGYGKGTAAALTALADDRRLSLTYVPATGVGPRDLTINLGTYPAPVTARWYNPTDGHFTAAAEKPLPNRSAHVFHTPGDNGTKANDWVLVVEVR
jgi:hypothetical protein